MDALLYYLVLPVVYFLSILPFRILYIISDGLYIILYYLLGYRKAVVLQNLRNSFPEKSEEEIQRICKGYYKYLCDMFLEITKNLTISEASMQKHCYFHPDAKGLFDKLAAENRSCILVIGHLGNFEWPGNTIGLQLKQQLFVIYHPIQNKYFDGLMLKIRTRFGSVMIPMKETFRVMMKHREELSITTFIADQTPQPDRAYWTTFLNQDTPVFMGTELIARKINYPVVYGTIKKVKRGYYEMYAKIICETPKDTKEGEISELHTRALEQDIIAQPEVWLWSHRRWKHKRPVG